MDTLLLTILHQIILKKERMRLDLIDFGFDSRRFDDSFEMFDGEVGDADVFSFSGFLEGDHGFPCCY